MQSPEQLRQIAAQLRAQAEQLEQLAAAQQPRVKPKSSKQKAAALAASDFARYKSGSSQRRST